MTWQKLPGKKQNAQNTNNHMEHMNFSCHVHMQSEQLKQKSMDKKIAMADSYKKLPYLVWKKCHVRRSKTTKLLGKFISKLAMLF